MTSRYDAIVVGAGHNGLCLAGYLGRAGLTTLVVERAPQAGGMAVTTQPLLPGFRHNLHANYLLYHDVMPMTTDFGLGSLGLRTIAPRAQHGVAFADGRPPIVLHRPDLLARTHASIARYSRPDADAFVALKTRAMTLQDVIARGMYTLPTRDWFDAFAASVETAYGDLGITGGIGRVTAKELIEDVFDTQELRAALFQVAAEFGASIDEVGSGFAFLGFVMWSVANWKLPVGGMGSLVRALEQACVRQGTVLLTGAPVERILVDGGRARGVVVQDHGPLYARSIVASSADLQQTYFELIGKENLSATTVREIEAFSGRPTPSLASLMFCLRKPPVYSSSRWDPDIDRCFHTVVGMNSAADALEHVRDVEHGRLPAPAAAVRVNTLWDRTQAPRGLHVAGADSFFPSVSSLDDAMWADVQRTYNDAFLSLWSEFAPNMTRENVIADHFSPPGQFDRKLLLRTGASQYRTEIEGLYLCGSSTYPGGGIHGACGFNAFHVIADDLGLSASNPSLT